MNETADKPKPKPRRRIWLRVSGYFLLTLVVLVSAAVAYVWLNKNQIKQQLLAQLNQTLNTSIKIEQIEIDFYHTFPQVSLDLQNVSVDDAFHKNKLLKAQHVYIGFNLLDIVNKNYRIRKISIDSGAVDIMINKQGKAGYMIFETDNVSSEKTFLKLQSVSFSRVKVRYDDKQHSQLYEAFIENLDCGLELEEDFFRLQANGGLFASLIKSGKVAWIKNKNVQLKTGFVYGFKKNEIAFQTSKINVNALEITLTGTIKNAPKHTDFNLVFNAGEADIPSLLAVVPFKIDLTNDWESTGNATLAGSVKGKLSAKEQPNVQLKFEIENGKLSHTKKDIQLSEINCKGVFQSNKNTGFLTLQPLSFKTGKSNVNGSVKLTDFNNLLIDANLQCHVEANDFIALSGLSQVKDADGFIDADIQCKGRLDDFSKNISAVNSSGNIKINLEDISFYNTNNDIEVLQADLLVKGADISINKLSATLEKSDINISGTLKNVYPYLFDKKNLVADIRYHSSFIDFKNLFLPIAPKQNEKQQEEEPFALPERITLKAAAQIDEFIYDKFNARNVSANINWVDNKIDVSNVKAQTMQGNINGQLQLNTAADGRFLLSSTSNLSNVNITELFQQCNNFSQKELTDKNLKGILNCKTEIVSVWNNKWECDLNKLYVTADVEVKNGELNNYEPLQNLSRFANVEDLKNLRFASLKNQIQIQNKTITIPEMAVATNAMNLTISGTHTFANYLDYRIKIRLSELLKKKRKPAENEFGEEEENGKGLSLFLTMKGPANDLKISYDKVGVKQKIKHDLKQEKENIKEILKKELGIGKDTTIKEKKTNSDELEFEAE